MATTKLMLRWTAVLALGAAACSAASPVAGTPETLAGLPLQRKVDGTAAMQAVAGLHRSGELDLDSAWIARYGVDTPSVLLYVGIASSPDRAAGLVAEMREALSRRPSPFRYEGERNIGRRTVHLLSGQDQYHYVFTDGPRAVWVSSDAAVAPAALAQTLGLSPDDPRLEGVPPASTVGSGPPALPELAPQIRRLVATGVLDTDRLEAALAPSGQPLTPDQRRVLDGEALPLSLRAENGAFLLNTLWALGLANRNPILTAGPMTTRSSERIERFASTGGWRLGRRPVTELYASMDLVPLAANEQTRLERVARAVYRPCCDNPTHFPDCNHGMAMLGLLTLLTARGADEAALFAAARDANAIWFPAQSAHVDTFLAALPAHEDRGPAMAVGPQLFSATGHRMLMTALAEEGGEVEGPGTPAC